MINRLAAVAVLVSLTTACGGSGTTTVTVTTDAAPTTTASTVSPAPMTVTVFRVVDGELVPGLAHVPRTQAVAKAALGALGVDANVMIANGTATVDLPKATQDKQAEIVYTLTHFASVKRVDVAGRTGLTRDDFASYLPPIFIETPVPGADVPPTFHVSGSASVFEATLTIKLTRGATVLETKTVTASEGAPARGTFDTTFTATPGKLVVTAFAPSAADGSPQHEVDVLVNVTP
jgi:hypothetical protein